MWTFWNMKCRYWKLAAHMKLSLDIYFFLLFCIFSESCHLSAIFLFFKTFKTHKQIKQMCFLCTWEDVLLILHVFHSKTKIAEQIWSLGMNSVIEVVCRIWMKSKKRLTVLEAVQIYWMTISLFLLRSLSLRGVFFSSLKFMSSWWKSTKWLRSDPFFLQLKEKLLQLCNKFRYTIIFSKRANISFSDVILDDNSSNWFEADDDDRDQSLELCLYWDNGSRSFLLPGIRILANLSSWTIRKKRLKKVTSTNCSTTTFIQGWNLQRMC